MFFFPPFSEVILTLGRSRTVKEFLCAAKEKNRSFRVFVAEGAPRFAHHTFDYSILIHKGTSFLYDLRHKPIVLSSLICESLWFFPEIFCYGSIDIMVVNQVSGACSCKRAGWKRHTNHCYNWFCSFCHDFPSQHGRLDNPCLVSIESRLFSYIVQILHYIGDSWSSCNHGKWRSYCTSRLKYGCTCCSKACCPICCGCW